MNYLDTVPIYGQSEPRLAPALKGKRDKFVLVTKVEATSKQDATWQVQESLQKTRAEYFDLVHLHNLGRTNRFPSLDVLLGDDGALAGLEALKAMVQSCLTSRTMNAPCAMRSEFHACLRQSWA